MSVLALGFALLLCAVSAFGDGIQVPLERKLPAGESSVEYAGQTIRFTSSLPLFVRFDSISPSQVQYKVRIQSGFALPSAPAGTLENTLAIYWVNVDTDIYNGGLPLDTLEGILNTEGGFVDR
jgi:hypothetical protein